jgi:hypothetical protein
MGVKPSETLRIDPWWAGCQVLPLKLLLVLTKQNTVVTHNLIVHMYCIVSLSFICGVHSFFREKRGIP